MQTRLSFLGVLASCSLAANAVQLSFWQQGLCNGGDPSGRVLTINPAGSTTCMPISPPYPVFSMQADNGLPDGCTVQIYDDPGCATNQGVLGPGGDVACATEPEGTPNGIAAISLLGC